MSREDVLTKKKSFVDELVGVDTKELDGPSLSLTRGRSDDSRPETSVSKSSRSKGGIKWGPVSPGAEYEYDDEDEDSDSFGDIPILTRPKTTIYSAAELALSIAIHDDDSEDDGLETDTDISGDEEESPSMVSPKTAATQRRRALAVGNVANDLTNTPMFSSLKTFFSSESRDTHTLSAPSFGRFTASVGITDILEGGTEKAISAWAMAGSASVPPGTQLSYAKGSTDSGTEEVSKVMDGEETSSVVVDSMGSIPGSLSETGKDASDDPGLSMGVDKKPSLTVDTGITDEDGVFGDIESEDSQSLTDLWVPSLRVIEELIATEESYVRGIREVLDGFYGEIEKQNMFGDPRKSRPTMQQIRSNLPQILQLSEMLLEAMKHAYQCIVQDFGHVKITRVVGDASLSVLTTMSSVSSSTSIAETPIPSSPALIQRSMSDSTSLIPESSGTDTATLQAVTAELDESMSSSLKGMSGGESKKKKGRKKRGRHVITDSAGDHGVIGRSEAIATSKADSSSDHRPKSIGSCFVFYAVWLKLYSTYTNDYAGIVDLFGSDKFRKNKTLQKFLRNKRKKQGLELVNLLIAPIQRIPRYLLLLGDYKKSLLKLIDKVVSLYDGCDKSEISRIIFVNIEKELDKAIELLNAVCQSVNENQREIENMSQLLYIQSQIHGLTHSIVAPYRKFRYEFTANKSGKYPRRFFVFNDIVLLVNDNWLVKQIIDIQTLVVQPLAGTGSTPLPSKPDSMERITSISSSAASHSAASVSAAALSAGVASSAATAVCVLNDESSAILSSPGSTGGDGGRSFELAFTPSSTTYVEFNIYAGSHSKAQWFRCQSLDDYEEFVTLIQQLKKQESIRRQGKDAMTICMGTEDGTFESIGSGRSRTVGATSLATDEALIRHLQDSWRLVDGMLKVTVHSGHDLVAADSSDQSSNPYFEIGVAGADTHYVQKKHKKKKKKKKKTSKKSRLSAIMPFPDDSEESGSAIGSTIEPSSDSSSLVSFTWKKEKKAKSSSRSIRKTCHPVWEQSYLFPIKNALYDRLNIRVIHWNYLPKRSLMFSENGEVLGELTVPILLILRQSSFGIMENTKFQLQNALKGSLKLSLKYYEEDSSIRPETRIAMETKAPGKPGVLTLNIYKANNLPAADTGGSSDPYCRCRIRDLIAYAIATTANGEESTVRHGRSFSLRSLDSPGKGFHSVVSSIGSHPPQSPSGSLSSPTGTGVSPRVSGTGGRGSIFGMPSPMKMTLRGISHGFDISGSGSSSSGGGDWETDIKTGSSKSKRTGIVKKSLNPEWNATLTFDVEDPHNSELIVEVFDWDRFTSDERLGLIHIPLYDLCTKKKRPLTQERVTVELDLPPEFSKKARVLPTLDLSYSFHYK